MMDGPAPGGSLLSIKTEKGGEMSDRKFAGLAPGGRLLSIKTEKGAEMSNRKYTVEEEPLSPAARLFHQPSMNCHIIAVVGTGTKIDVEKFKAGLESTVVHHPRFSSILVSHGRKRPIWVRTKVVTDEHLVVPDMKLGSATTSPDKLVEDYVSSLSTTYMDPSRPLWEFHLLDIRTSDAEAVVILRIHHSLGDGVSLISFLLASTRKISDPESLPTVPVANRRTPSKHHCMWAIMIRLWAVIVLLWHTVVDFALFLATIFFLQDTKTPLTGTDGVEFRQKRFLHRSVRLDDVKAIKNAMGCTVNDVLVGVTSAGLSRYLSRRFNDGNDLEKKKGLPNNIRIRSTLMVNIRPAPGLQDIAEMMKGKGGGARWGNCFGFVIIPFTIFNCEDPLDYVRKGKATAQRKKYSLEAFFTHKAAIWAAKILGIKVIANLYQRVLKNTTLCFSNVFGPIEEISLYGHPMIYLAPSVYGHPQALTLHFQSYMNKLTMVVAVDEMTIPDPHRLLDDLEESLNLIKEAATTSA